MSQQKESKNIENTSKDENTARSNHQNKKTENKLVGDRPTQQESTAINSDKNDKQTNTTDDKKIIGVAENQESKNNKTFTERSDSKSFKSNISVNKKSDEKQLENNSKKDVKFIEKKIQPEEEPFDLEKAFDIAQSYDRQSPKNKRNTNMTRKADDSRESVIRNKHLKMNDQRSMKVADHYNKIQSLTFGERKMSKIINLRNINNFIKAVLINLYVKQNDTVLDLGCGKGGDLLKYKKRGIKYLYGIDIANESINEFERRIHSQNKPFDVDLSVNDICNEEIDLKKQFDVISLQFSLHYSFETEKTFKTLFNTILRHSKIGTRILITTIDQSSILKMYNEKLVTNKPCGHCKKQSMCVGNSLFHIKLGDITKYKTFGNVYSFFLNEAVDECEEFLLPCGFLVDEFEQNGFELKENKCFGNFLEKYKDKFSYLRKRMVPNEPSKEEKEVIDIYRALVLEKIE